MAIPPILWQPSERAIEEAQITQFARQIVRKRRLELNSYPEFYRWSVDNPEEFWSDVWEFCGVIAARKGNTARRRRQDAGRALVPGGALEPRPEPPAPRRPRRRVRVLGRVRLQAARQLF